MDDFQRQCSLNVPEVQEIALLEEDVVRHQGLLLDHALDAAESALVGDWERLDPALGVGGQDAEGRGGISIVRTGELVAV